MSTSVVSSIKNETCILFEPLIALANREIPISHVPEALLLST